MGDEIELEEVYDLDETEAGEFGLRLDHLDGCDAQPNWPVLAVIWVGSEVGPVRDLQPWSCVLEPATVGQRRHHESA